MPAATIGERARDLRALAERKASAYRAIRLGGAADVVVVRSDGARREGVTGDYLDVVVPDMSRSRGERFNATLVHGSRGELQAV